MKLQDDALKAINDRRLKVLILQQKLCYNV